MARINEIFINNFKSFSDLTIKFDKQNVNVVLGDNGVGKTSFIEVFDFIRRIWNRSEVEYSFYNNPQWMATMDQRFLNLYDSYYSLSNEELKPIEVKIVFSIQNVLFEYYVRLSYEKNLDYIEKEYLYILNKSPNSDRVKKILFEKELDKTFFIENEILELLSEKKEFYDEKMPISFMSLFNFHLLFRRKIAPQNQKYLLMLKSIINLFKIPFKYRGFEKYHWFDNELEGVMRILKNNPNAVNLLQKKLEEFQEFVRAIDDKVLKLEWVQNIVDNNANYDEYEINFFKKINNKTIKIPISLESSGTKRYLLYFSLIQWLKEESIVFFDEFGLDLSNALASQILSYIKKQIEGTDKQIFLTTHNSFLLKEKYLTNSEKWIITKNSLGKTNFTNLKGKNIRENNFEKFLNGDYGGKSKNEELII